MSDSLIQLALDAQPITELFGRITRRMGGKPALMREVANIMLDEVEANFAAQGRPRWADLKSVDLRRAGYTRTKGGRLVWLKRNSRPGYQILQVSGRLASSITMAYDAQSATVGTNVVYAAIHQFGGKTRPHVIRAKRAKALALPGIGPRRQVNHPGSTIPARPFLMVSPAGEAAIVRAGESFLRAVITEGM